MTKKLHLQDNGTNHEVKNITIFNDAQKLKTILGTPSWKILTLLSKKKLYPINRPPISIHEQIVYYHIRKLQKQVL
jgi:hypothetical protein